MNYTEWYTHITRPFRRDGAARAIGMLDRALVVGFALAYVALLIILIVTGNSNLVRAVIVPAATFALVTVLRIAINRPRPYEAHDIDALVQKDTHGKSMPSRHMSSAVIIAFTYSMVWPLWGGILFAACACIAFTRIVGGVHYPTDIAAAIAIGLVCGAVGFFVL